MKQLTVYLDTGVVIDLEDTFDINSPDYMDVIKKKAASKFLELLNSGTFEIVWPVDITV